jgi:hypothetical protein
VDSYLPSYQTGRDQNGESIIGDRSHNTISTVLYEL